MNDWFRSWHNAPLDVKWLGVARKAGVPVGTVVSIVWACLDRASQAQVRGSIDGMDVDGLADFFGYDRDDVERVVAALHDRNVLSNDRFTKWDARQPKRERYDQDNDATARKQASRAKNGAKRGGGDGGTDDVTPCHATSHHITPNATTSRTEEIREDTDITSPGGEEPAPPAAEPVAEPELAFAPEDPVEPDRPKLRLVEPTEILPPERPAAPRPEPRPPDDETAEARLFRTGREVLAKGPRPLLKGSSLIAGLFNAHGRDVAITQRCVDQAREKHNPGEFLGACLREAKAKPKSAVRPSHDRDAIANMREELTRAGYC